MRQFGSVHVIVLRSPSAEPKNAEQVGFGQYILFNVLCSSNFLRNFVWRLVGRWWDIEEKGI